MVTLNTSLTIRRLIQVRFVHVIGSETAFLALFTERARRLRASTGIYGKRRELDQ